MNKLYIMIFSFILFLSCSNAGKINWESDFEASVEKSKSENKIIMMDIYTDWCGACKEMDKNVFRNKNVADSSTNFIALKFNPRKNA
ncbi:thioredoxin family protein [Brachyspira hampsonii]|uniref:thioredoxin family protein n=1 Tax=Brachyspira hampsonii TaxID=1287055 RepID=UPI00034680D1|nr:thioredoxin family protein [Brachyspira hampsonii]